MINSKLFMLSRNICNHLTVCKQMNKVSYKVIVYMYITDFHDFLLPFIPIIHISRQVFQIKSRSRYVLVGRPTLVCPYEGVYEICHFILASPAVYLMSCSSYLVLEIGCKLLYSCCFIGCCFQDLFNIAHSILVLFPFVFFSIYQDPKYPYIYIYIYIYMYTQNLILNTP